MTTTLETGSTVPSFITEFAGAMFFDSPQEGGGLFAVGQEDETNILLFPDTNDVALGGNEVDIIMAGEGDDNIMGNDGTDFMFGGLGDDIVRGGEGDDVVVGNQGSDVLISGEGSDIYEYFADQILEGDVDTILDFESGQDAIVVVGSTDVSYEAATGAFSVDGAEVGILEAGLDVDVLVRENSAVIFDNGGILDLPAAESSEELLVKDTVEETTETTTDETSAPTLAPGSTVPLFITEFAGAMFFDSPQEGGGLYAAGQEDTTNILLFEEANDVAVGGDEADVIMGDAGDDNIMGAEGTDFMFGGLGDDIVRGGAGDDVVVGNQGSDVLISGEGSDVYEYFADQILEGDLDVILDFELGQDSIVVVGSTNVNYEVSSGLLSVDGLDVAVLEAGLDSSVITRENSTVIF